MKKLLTLMAAMLLCVGASAQFQKGKGYLGASLTGLNLSYNSDTHLNFGVEAKAGYLFADNLMLLGNLGYMHTGGDDDRNDFEAGVGGRYYITQNGLYLGLNCNYRHASGYNDILPGLEIGYAFFINRSVTIEPAIYYDQSFKSSDYSTIGLRIGLGIYLFDD